MLANVKWFLIWALIYAFLLLVLDLGVNSLASSYDFLNSQIAYFLLMAFGLALFGRIISCAMRKKTFYLDSGLVYWTILFVIGLLLVDFIMGLFHWDGLNSNLINLLIRGLLLSLLIGFLKRAKFGGRRFRFSNLPGWFWWIIIIGGIVFLIQFHVPYDEPRPLSDFNLKCEGGKIIIENDMFGLGKWATDMEAGMTCLDYKSSRCMYVCDGEVPACQCETALIHYLFTREGEWIFGGW